MENRTACFVETLKRCLGCRVTIFLANHRVRGTLTRVDADGCCMLSNRDDGPTVAQVWFGDGPHDAVTVLDLAEAVGIGTAPAPTEPMYRWSIREESDERIATMHSRHPLATNNEIEMAISATDSSPCEPSELVSLIAKIPGVNGISGVERYSINIHLAAVAKFADVRRIAEVAASKWSHEHAEEIGEGVIRPDAKPALEDDSLPQDAAELSAR